MSEQQQEKQVKSGQHSVSGTDREESVKEVVRKIENLTITTNIHIKKSLSTFSILIRETIKSQRS